MEPDINREVLDVRRAIEQNTSKVSLRDLEKKGFRQVKVLRAGDINQMIAKAVQNALARQPQGGMSEAERQKIMAEAKAEVDRQLAEKRALQQQSAQIQQAHQNLEVKLAEVNRQLEQEKKAFLAEKAAFQRDRQALMEKSLDGQRAAAQTFETQINDLKERLARAESVGADQVTELKDRLARAEAAASEGVSAEEHEQVRRRFNAQVDDLQEDVDRYRKRIRAVEEEAEQEKTQLKRRLSEDVERLEGEIARLRAELEEARAGAGAGGGGASDAELQRMRMEFEQRQGRMQEMMAGIANSLVQARSAPAAEAPDMSKQFLQLQQSISDAVRKAAGRGAGADIGVDLTAEQAAALFANMDESVTLESNIKDVKLKEQSAAGVKDKLAKLRNLRKK